MLYHGELFSIQKNSGKYIFTRKGQHMPICRSVGETVNSIINTNTWQLQFVCIKPLITGAVFLPVSVSNPLIGVF